jgi:arylsulfatase A-like enzyme
MINAIGLALLAILPATALAADKPNIILLIADDLGRNDVGFMGGRDIKTPHLDALAASGAILNHFYVQPVCTPTRAALLTGRYPMRHGLQVGVIRPWHTHGLPLDERTLPQALKEAGYTTSMSGKWHLGSADKSFFPTSRGFDHHLGHLFGAIDYFTHIRDGKLDWYRDGEPLKQDGYATHLIAADAANTIRHQPKDKPLFLYVAFNAVHAPHQVPDKYTEPYKHLRGVRRTYAGMLAAMDEGVGQITAAIDGTGRRDNTLFIFASDNGGPQPGRVTDNGPLRAGKGTLYDGGVRVCAFAAWQGRIKPNTTIDHPLHIADWYPTLLNLTGAPLQQKLPLDGKDIWPVLTQGAPSPHEDILIHAEPTRGALRAGDWKLVITRDNVELFNLAADPSEKTNLADKEPDRLATLRARYDAYARQALPPLNQRGD